MIAYADDSIDTAAGVLTVQIEIDFFTDARYDRKSHSAKFFSAFCVDNVAFDGRH